MQVFVLMWHDSSGKGKDADGGVIGVFQSMENAETKLVSIALPPGKIEDYTILRSQYGIDYTYSFHQFNNEHVPIDMEYEETFGEGTVTFMICERKLE